MGSLSVAAPQRKRGEEGRRCGVVGVDLRDSNRGNPIVGPYGDCALGYVALSQKLIDLVIVISLARISPRACYLEESPPTLDSIPLAQC